MAEVHGSNSYLSVDGTDVSAYTDNATLSFSVATADVTAFADDDNNYIAGTEDATISHGGNWDATQDGVSYGTFDQATVATVVGPAGNVGGNVSYTQNALVTGYSIQMNSTNKVTFSASYQRTGATTRGTF